MLRNWRMNNINNLTVQQLRQAADLKEKIASLEKQLGQLLGGTTNTAEVAAPKRKMSASAIAKIRAAQKKRWAKIKGNTAAAKPAKKRGGKMSAAAKAAVSARMKAYWAARKAAKK